MALVSPPQARRGLLEVALVVLVAALAATAVAGTGLSRTVLHTQDPLTWLRNGKGQVIRVNPETGSPTDRLKVAAPGDPIQVVQGDGVLVVTNLRTHEVTVVDLSMLRVAGTPRENPGEVKILLSQRQIFLVDKASGRVEALDALTGATVGSPYRSGSPLVDAVVDGAGVVWALGADRQLVSLRFSGAGFVEQARREVVGAGGQTVLVAHDTGVTAVDPAGSATSVAPGARDATVRTAQLQPPLEVPELSPANLVPVASSQSDRLHLVRPDAVVNVDGHDLGCADLGRPEVYRGMIYLPCPRDHKVVVLDSDGHRSGDDLRTSSLGTPELVLNAGLLIVNVVGASAGLVVLPDGTTKPLRTDDPGLPVQDPAGRPTALPSGMGIVTTSPQRRGQSPTPQSGQGGRAASTPPRNTGPSGAGPSGTGSSGAGSTGTASGTPSGKASSGPTATSRPTGTAGPTATPRPSPSRPSPSTTSPAPRPADFTPTGVAVQARPDGSVLVSWKAPPNTPSQYRILPADTGAQLATALGGATSAIVSSPPIGQSVRYVVEAVFPGASYRSAPSDPVTAYGRPGAPRVSVQLLWRTPAQVGLSVTVEVVDNGGQPVDTYGVSVTAGSGHMSGSASVPIGQNPYQVVVSCTGGTADLCFSGGPVTAAATLHNPAGTGPEGAVTATIDPEPAWQYGTNVLIATSGGKCLDQSLRVRTCDGSAGELWQFLRTGDIRNPSHSNNCLASNNGLHFASDGCTDAEKRWDLNPAGSFTYTIRNQSTHRCLYVNGDPAGENVPFADRNCQLTTPELLSIFTPVARLSSVRHVSGGAADATPDRTADAPVGLDTMAALLLPLAAVAVGRRSTRRRWRPVQRSRR